MKIYLSPQQNNEKIEYSFNGEVVSVEYKGVKDNFDLSTFPEGAQFEGVETTLDINPIVDVKRENGVLFVTLLNFISSNATEKEKFPEWMEV
ncbi:hypothetical protein GCM10008908_05810 [Clostridium subterminale]|uniref:Uncharacterized protein n=1 Tax=Clostridium subterminale TaxID=1550 RepID=A0ABP3VSY6_CLOSU